MNNSITFPGLKVDSVRYGSTDSGEKTCSIIAHEIGKKDCPSFLLVAKEEMAEYIERAGTREGDYVSVTGHVSMYVSKGKTKLDIIIENFFNMGNIDKKKEDEVKERQMAKNTICFFDLTCVQQNDTTCVKFSRAANNSQAASFSATEKQGGMSIRYTFQAFDESAKMCEELALVPGDHIAVKATMQPYEKKDEKGNISYLVNFKLKEVSRLAKGEITPTTKIVKIPQPKAVKPAPKKEVPVDVFRTPLGSKHFG